MTGLYRDTTEALLERAASLEGVLVERRAEILALECELAILRGTEKGLSSDGAGWGTFVCGIVAFAAPIILAVILF